MTPAGDDWLAGWLLALWTAPPAPSPGAETSPPAPSPARRGEANSPLPWQGGGEGGGRSVAEIILATAAVWDARPDWTYLRARWERIAAGAKIIARILTERGITLTSCGLPQTDCDALSRYPFRNPQSAIRNLIGLGPGLTPAGDDWLAGWLLALWTAPPAPSPGAETSPPAPSPARRGEANSPLPWQGGGEGGGRSVAEIILATAARTTILSRAFLACAAAGEADESWHDLLNALASESANQRISESTRVILAHGATSGAAMLMGFVAGIDV